MWLSELNVLEVEYNKYKMLREHLQNDSTPAEKKKIVKIKKSTNIIK